MSAAGGVAAAAVATPVCALVKRCLYTCSVHLTVKFGIQLSIHSYIISYNSSTSMPLLLFQGTHTAHTHIQIRSPIVIWSNAFSFDWPLVHVRAPHTRICRTAQRHEKGRKCECRHKRDWKEFKYEIGWYEMNHRYSLLDTIVATVTDEVVSGERREYCTPTKQRAHSQPIVWRTTSLTYSYFSMCVCDDHRMKCTAKRELVAFIAWSRYWMPQYTIFHGRRMRIR